MSLKALIVGWDGATWKYIDPLLAEGRLPHLQALLAQGTRARLTSTIPPYTNVAWPSLVTGLRPDGTGVFDTARTAPGSYHPVPTNLTGFRGIPFWQWVNRFGLTTGVLNVPMTYPAHPLDGYMVTGFDSPLEGPHIAYPTHILDQWARSGHPYRILAREVELMARQNPHHPRDDLDAFTDAWVALTLEQGEWVAWALHEWPVDLLFVVFSGTDSINHRTHSKEHIARVYEAADRALGRILEHADENTLFALVSDHGSTPAYRYISLYRIFYDAGWLRFHPYVAPHFLRRLPSPFGPLLASWWERLPDRLRRLLSRPLLRRDPRLAVAADNIHWERTRAFVRSALGPIYIHRTDRYPRGTVSPEEYTSLRQAIATTLLNLRDDEGHPLIGQVWFREELYPRAKEEDDPPDLVFIPARYSDHPITGYPTDPLVRPIPEEGEYGTHTPDGVLLLAGPGVRQGSVVDEAHLTDVVPTVLALLGLPLPRPLDGRVLEEALREPVPVRYLPVDEEDAGDTRPVSPDASSEILQRLRDLGYL